MNLKITNSSSLTAHSRLLCRARSLAGVYVGMLTVIMMMAAPKVSGAGYDRGAMESGRQALVDGNYAKAITDLTEAIRRGPNIPYNYKLRGSAYRRNGDYSQALADYNEAARIGETNYWNAFCLARLLATCPDDKIRDGHKAVALAEKICEATKWENPLVIDTLAAAKAEVGDFAEAASLERKVLKFNDSYFGTLEAARQRLSLYEEKKPYREVLGGKSGDMAQFW